jgi:hypothetical protein
MKCELVLAPNVLLSALLSHISARRAAEGIKTWCAWGSSARDVGDPSLC